VLMNFLTALDMLPLDKKVDFFKACYCSQESRLLEKLAKDHRNYWMPVLPLKHEGIVCDGCSQSPLEGLRFRCQTLPDVDLCAACFTNKSHIHHGEYSAHEFDIVPAWSKGAGKGWEKFWKGACGKGMAKGSSQAKGKGKGKKGKCRNWYAQWCQEDTAFDVAPEFAEMKQKEDDIEHKEHFPAVDTEPHFDFTFPVVVQDGRRLTISWNRTDDLDQIATTFADAHDIIPEELPTIKAFLEHARNMCEGSKVKDDSPTDASPANEDLKDAQKQLEEMGLGDGEVLLEMLKSHGGSVQRVIEDLTVE